MTRSDVTDVTVPPPAGPAAGPRARTGVTAWHAPSLSQGPVLPTVTPRLLGSVALPGCHCGTGPVHREGWRPGAAEAATGAALVTRDPMKVMKHSLASWQLALRSVRCYESLLQCI